MNKHALLLLIYLQDCLKIPEQYTSLSWQLKNTSSCQMLLVSSLMKPCCAVDIAHGNVGKSQ